MTLITVGRASLTKVVNADNDAFKTGVWVAERIHKIFIANNSTENALIIAEEDECLNLNQLA
jgi:hypothetical protein